MKFGSQILDKSVTQWRHNNIDYQKLKVAIKKATTDGLNGEADQINLKRCTILFLEQFNSVNLFTSLKIKEISSKIIGIENLILKYSENLAIPNFHSVSPDETKRQIKAIRHSTNRCNKELKMLSKYLILQKIATRKLFKKFIKYYQKGRQAAEDYINTLKNSEQLTTGYEGVSFMVLTLDPYLLEISLIFDVLNDLSIKTSNNLDVIKSSLVPVTAGTARNIETNQGIEPLDKEISSTIEFDTLFWGKSTYVNRFLLSNENTEELKFILLSSNFQLLNDEIISTSREIVDNSEYILNLANINTARSVRSYNELRNAASLSSLVGNTKFKINKYGSPTLTSNLTMALLVPSEETSDNIRYIKNLLSDNNYNEHPSFLVHSDIAIKCLLQCYVGGLRDHIITNTLPLKYVLNSIENKENQENQKLSPLNKLSVEWIQSRDLKLVDHKITFKRTRFVSYTKDSTYLITLDEDIDIDINAILPHCIFEIREILSNKSSNFSSDSVSSQISKEDLRLSTLYDSLVENQIQCYPMKSYSTLWNICYAVNNSNDIQYDLFSYALKDEYDLEEGGALKDSEFFELGKDKVLALCTKDFQVKYKNTETENNTHNHFGKQILKMKGGLQSEPRSPSSPETVRGRKRTNDLPNTEPIRYWNEFDDDETNFTNNTFYVDIDEDGTHSNNYSGDGFLRFDRKFVNDMFAICQKIRNFLNVDNSDTTNHDLRSRYGSIISDDDDSVASTDTVNNNYEDIQQLIQFQEQDLDDSDSMYEFKHDEIVSFMYLFALFASCLTSGICISIISTIFREEKEKIKIEHIKALISIVIISLIISLLLTGGSLLLLFSRYSYAPLWHYISCLVVFLTVTCSVCYGIIEIYT